ncbi:MAG: hypothetical protein NT125_07570 [Candidatus Bipolaricaulota bacterium]|nr:hypothetical protein [Candidatus Bipolaricaulota bacterium]
MGRGSRRIERIIRVAVVAGVALASLLSASAPAGTAGTTDATYQRIHAAVVPPAGTDTSYGIPLALVNLPQFIAWRDSIALTSAEQQVFYDALVQIAAPCCDDETAFQCCCEKGGGRCNIITSAKGLAAYLVHEKGYPVDATRDAVLQWLAFARPDYYVAKALRAEGLDPAAYGVTTQGSCYRGLCETPISQGGCGGMGPVIEPTIQGGKA